MAGKRKDPNTFWSNVKDFLQGFLKIGVAPNAPAKCIGCGKCGAGQGCPFGAKRPPKTSS